MWNDDGDYHSYHNKDEDNWERMRNDLYYKVDSLTTLLVKLNVIKPKLNNGNWFEFIDRHWKV
jgi:hypothetical protein